jgi:hypothetical protein
MIANSELLPTSPPKIKLKRGFFLLIMLGLSVYFQLPQVARIEQALRVASTLQPGSSHFLCFEHPQSIPDRLEAAWKGRHDLS